MTLIDRFEHTFFLEAITAASSATSREQLLSLLCDMLVRANHSASPHIYLYDTARRLLPVAPFTTTELVGQRWQTIGRALTAQQAICEAGCVMLPLVAAGQTLGIVLLSNEVANEVELSQLGAITNIFAQALRLLDLQTALAKQQHEIAATRAFQQAVLGSHTYEELAEYSAVAVQQLCGSLRSMIFLLEADNWLQPILRRDSVPHSAIPIDGSQIGSVIRTLQPLTCTISTEQWNNTNRTIPTSVALLAAPLLYHGKPLGVLTALGAQEGFTPHDLTLITAFAEHIALAIARLRRDQPAEVRTNPLTKRERDVLCMIGRGLSNQQIASQLGITDRTVSTHLGNILGKLGLTSRTQAALYAHQHGLSA